MDHATLAILMLFVGLVLVIAEFFIPSGGLIAILATVCLAVAIWAAYEAWWETNRSVWWSFLLTVVLLTPLSIGGAFFLIQRTSLGNHVLLRAPSLDEVTPYSAEEERLRATLGKRGKTVSLLNPGGMVSIDGERFHCECPGMLIEAGNDVEVTDVKGNRLVVIPVTDLPEARDNDSLASSDSRHESSSRIPNDNEQESEATPLDFDIPQS